MYNVRRTNVNGNSVDHYEISSMQPTKKFVCDETKTKEESIENLNFEANIWKKIGGYVEMVGNDRAFFFEGNGRLVYMLDVEKKPV